MIGKTRKTVRAAALVLAGLALGSSQGCASLIVTAFEPTVYGGVQADGSLLKSTFDEPAPLLSLLLLADLGASTAVDTALLPITVPCALSGTKHGLLSVK